VACGNGRNGLFFAQKGFQVVLLDRSWEALQTARQKAVQNRLSVNILCTDLETKQGHPLAENTFGIILVFRYLHRPLIPHLKKVLKNEGFLFYETFTVEQRRYGKPSNPHYLLEPEELMGWFEDWRVFYYFEGLRHNPDRFVAQIICKKP
jgi:SAM-dependent methyltransferase